jgi:signal transduction histidine kinase
MNKAATFEALRSLVQSVDPRRSQAASTVWLIIGLSVTFSIAAAVWVGGLARENIVEQHERRLALETDQLSSDLSQAVAERLGAMRAERHILDPTDTSDVNAQLLGLFQELSLTYPQLVWLLVADEHGRVLTGNMSRMPSKNVSEQAWFAAALRSPVLGMIAPIAADPVAPADSSGVTSLGDMAAPVTNSAGRVVGVIVTHLRWPRSSKPTLRLTDEPDPTTHAEAALLDRDGTVVAGAPLAVGVRRASATAWKKERARFEPHFEVLPGGRRMLVARAPLSAAADAAAEWMVQLSEPDIRVYQRANALRKQILWVSIGLGIFTALLGGLGAHQLTARLRHLAASVARVKHNAAEQIEIPNGVDEVALLARAFADLLDDLQLERAGLKSLSLELERRVAVRTSEVQRLAEDARYAAIVRERLKIARDLHDTLAHSMMAMLSEIRYLRRIQIHNPAMLADELARAEEVAHEGLEEARTAITQMRETAVRDIGLGPALAAALERLIDSTGVTGEFVSEPGAARFGDERAETLARMAQEALRNIERHASASRVVMTLRGNDADLDLTIQDDGVGFDPTSARAGHYGIVGLYEQAELIGARLQIISHPGQGTRICISLRVTPTQFDAVS